MSDPREPRPGQPPAADAEQTDQQDQDPTAELSEEDLEFIREAKRNFAERYARPRVSKKMQEKMQSGVSDLDP